MILEKFLPPTLPREKKDEILNVYKEFMVAYADNDGKFKKYTAKSVKRMIDKLHYIKTAELESLKSEELLVLAMSLKAVLVRLDKGGINPESSQVTRNSPDFDYNVRK